MCDMADRLAAWAAGIYEGEGCLTVSYTPGGRPKVRLSINMTDCDVLERFATVVGGHVTGPYDRGGTRKAMFYWQLGGYVHVKRIYALFEPYLGERRTARFLEILAMEPSPDDPGGHYLRDRTHCKNGHEFTPENTYFRRDRSNERVCLMCRRAQQAKRRRRLGIPARAGHGTGGGG